MRIWNSIISVASMLQDGVIWGLNPSRRKRCLFSKMPEAHTASYPVGNGFFPQGYSSRGMKLATHLHLVMKYGME
jgi:hypothetical protein